MAFLERLLKPVTDTAVAQVKKELSPLVSEIKKSHDEETSPRALVLDPYKLFYRKTEKGLRKPTRITFQTLRRMSKAVHIARLCINTLKHRISQTEWTIKPAKGVKKPDPVHVKVLENFFEHPNRNGETFRTFLNKILEDVLALDAACYEKVLNHRGFPSEVYYVDGSTIKPMYDFHGILGDPAYAQFMPMNSGTQPDAEWSKDEFTYIMQNPQADIQNFGYGLSPLEGVIMVATNILNADMYMGNFFDMGTLPPKLINLGKELGPNEVEAFRAYWKSEIEGKPWKTGFVAGADLQAVDLGSNLPQDMLFEKYQVWLMKLMTAAYEISPQDIGMTAEMGMNRAMSQVQKDISQSKGYLTLLNLLKEIFNNDFVKSWFKFDDVVFDWVGLDIIDPIDEARIFAIESKAGAVSINEYRAEKGLPPIKGGVKPFVIVPSIGIQYIDATPLDEVAEKEIENEMDDSGDSQDKSDESVGEQAGNAINREVGVKKEGDYGAARFGGRTTDLDDIRGIRYPFDEVSDSSTTSKRVEKKVHVGDYICWMDDRGYGQPFIWTDKFGKQGYVIKPPIGINLNGMWTEEKNTEKMAEAGLNVIPVKVVSVTDLGPYLPNVQLRHEFRDYQQMAPEYYSKKWEMKFGHSRVFDNYTVMPYIEGRSLTDAQLVEDMKRVPQEYEKMVRDLVALWKYEKAHGMADRRSNQYIVTPDKRAYGIDYQMSGNKKAWERYENSIAKALMPIPFLYNLFVSETGIDSKGLQTKKSIEIKKKERSNEGWFDFWHRKVSVPENKMIDALGDQSKKLKSNMAQVIQDQLVARKSRVPDKILSEAAQSVPVSDIGLSYTKSVEDHYKNSFELGIDNFLAKVASKLPGVTRDDLWKIVGKMNKDGISKAIERSGLYDKLKERGTNMIKTVAGNKQKKLVQYIQDEADKGRTMDTIAEDALQKFSLPLEDWEIKRIAATETAWAANQGAVTAGQEIGIQEYDVLLDPDAEPECVAEYDGQVFTANEIASDAPPLHPNCRCIVQPVIDAGDVGSLVDSINSQL